MSDCEVKKGRYSMQAEGDCICVKCGIKATHIQGVKCMQTKCPDCGNRMLRENSQHHKAFLNRQA
ncbi:MAG: hypothetical protein KAG96_04430 [Ichthyobacteriaceae bacterium]|nr:hypothetical protein [Ichthyobacteriaceae bacterium]